MESKDIYNLQEAYMEVYASQKQLNETGQTDARIRDNIRRYKGSKVEYTPPRNWDPEANRGQGATVSAKQAEKRRRKALRQEEMEVYDIILSHLLDEGYAETVESAEAIMVNMSEDWRDDIIENVGSYNDPVLGPQSPIGKAVRTAGRAVTGAVTGAVKGAKDTRQGKFYGGAVDSPAAQPFRRAARVVAGAVRGASSGAQSPTTAKPGNPYGM